MRSSIDRTNSRRSRRPFHRFSITALAFGAIALLAACGTSGADVPQSEDDPTSAARPALAVYSTEAEALFASSAFAVGADAEASLGTYLHQVASIATTEQGTPAADVSFEVAKTGNHTLWARVYAPSEGSDVAYLGFDGTTQRLVVPVTGRFEWHPVTTVRLTPGTRTLSLGHGSAGLRIDLLVVTRTNVEADDLDQLVVPAPGPAPSPVPGDPEDPEPNPSEPGRVAPSLRGDPDFDASALSPDVAEWHARVLYTIANPGTDLDPFEAAASDDLYTFGRTLQVYVQSVLVAFRMTGDLALLDHVDQIAERMRADLRDEWRGTLDGSDGTRDGYLNWVWRYSSGDAYVGKDTHQLDEMKTHAMVTMIAAALEANRDLRSPTGRSYAAHADFWADYLVNHFEAKWRDRVGKSSGFPIMTRPHMNTYLSWTKWHYYMGELTGVAAYTAEAERMATIWWNEIRSVSTGIGTAYVWPRSVLALGGSQEYLMPTVYASGVFADAVEFHLAGFHRFAATEEIERFVRTFTEFVMDTSDPVRNGLAPDIGGGVARAGIPSDGTNWKRLTTHGFWLSGYPLIAAWDSTGKVAAFAEAAYASRGSSVGMMLESGALLDGMWTDASTLSASAASTSMR